MGYNPQLAGGVNKKCSRQMPQHIARQESVSSLQYIEHLWDPTFSLLASLEAGYLWYRRGSRSGGKHLLGVFCGSTASVLHIFPHMMLQQLESQGLFLPFYR